MVVKIIVSLVFFILPAMVSPAVAGNPVSAAAVQPTLYGRFAQILASVPGVSSAANTAQLFFSHRSIVESTFHAALFHMTFEEQESRRVFIEGLMANVNKKYDPLFRDLNAEHKVLQAEYDAYVKTIEQFQDIWHLAKLSEGNKKALLAADFKKALAICSNITTKVKSFCEAQKASFNAKKAALQQEEVDKRRRGELTTYVEQVAFAAEQRKKLSAADKEAFDAIVKEVEPFLVEQLGKLQTPTAATATPTATVTTRSVPTQGAPEAEKNTMFDVIKKNTDLASFGRLAGAAGISLTAAGVLYTAIARFFLYEYEKDLCRNVPGKVPLPFSIFLRQKLLRFDRSSFNDWLCKVVVPVGGTALAYYAMMPRAVIAN